MSSPSLSLDRLGIVASLTCAVHCALMPLAMSLLPLFLRSERLEWALVGGAAVLGGAALLQGYRRHRTLLPLCALGLGLTLLISGRLWEEAGGRGGLVCVVLGGAAVALGHFLNHRRSACR